MNTYMKYRKIMGIVASILLGILFILVIISFTNTEMLSKTIMEQGFLYKIEMFSVDCLLPILVLARCALLAHRDTKMALVNAGYIYATFTIIVELIVVFANFELPGIASTILSLFGILVIAYSFIFEVEANNTVVTVAQYISAGFMTAGCGLYLFNVITEKGSSILGIISLSLDSSSKQGSPITPSLLLVLGVITIIMLPALNSLFEEEIKESNVLDEVQQQKTLTNQTNTGLTGNFVQGGTVTSGYTPQQNIQPQVQPVVQPQQVAQPQQTIQVQPAPTEEPIDNKSIPVISTPVAVNSNEANRVSNTIN